MEWWSNGVMGVWARRQVGPKGLGTWPRLPACVSVFYNAFGLKDRKKAPLKVHQFRNDENRADRRSRVSDCPSDRAPH
jgi:hypothetical protein